MEDASQAPRSLIFSTRLYQALLAVYPPEFRRDYGGPMLQVFRDCCRQALRQAGAAGLLALWGRTALDTVQAALEQHFQRGVDMSKEKFIKLTGWALMLGPVLFFIGGWANNRPRYSPYDLASLPIDRYAKIAAVPLIVFGLVFISLGIFGMLLRYSSRFDSARTLLAIAALSGLVSAVGAGVVSVNDSSPWWQLFILGMAVQNVALVIFGFISLRRKLLPRWNGLPLLALWFPVALFLSSGLIRWEITSQLLAALWILTCVMFAGLGFLLQADSRPVRELAAGA